MNVKTTMVLLLVLVVGVGTYLIVAPKKPAPGTADADAEPKKSEPMYELAQLVKFELERPDKPKLVFEKPLKAGQTDQYDDWRMLEPVQAKTSNWEVNSFAEKFKAPKSLQKFTPGQGGFPTAEKCGLAEPQAVVTVTDKAGASRTLQIGARVFGSDETYVKLAGEDQAYVAELNVREDLKKDVKKFRSKDLFSFDKANAVQVKIEHEGKIYTVVKGEGDKWVIDQPVEAVADKSKLDSLLSDIRYLRADDFIEDEPKKLTPFGLDKPKTAVTVTVEKKITKEKKDEGDEAPTTTKAAEPEFEIQRTTHTLAFGGEADLEGKKVYAKLGDKPWVVSVTKTNYEKVQPDLDAWRNPQVTQAKVLDARKINLKVAGKSITLEKKGGTWRMVAPSKGKVDAAAVSDLLSTLNGLKAVSWVDKPGKDKAKYGLDKPRAEITLNIKGQPAVERILVGGDTESGMLTYVHQAASPPVAVVKLDQAKKLLAPVSSYRDRSILTLSKARTDKIELTRKGRPAVVLAKQKGAWTMTKPVTAEADTDAVNDLLGELASLKATQIAGEGKLAEFGLDKPELTLTVTEQPPKPKPTTKKASTKPATTKAASTKPAKGKKAATKAAKKAKPTVHKLLVAKKGDTIYAARPGGKLIYQLSQATYDNLTAETHDRKVFDFKVDQAVGVEVVGGVKPLKFKKDGDDWTYLPDPHLAVDAKKVKDMITALRDLKAEDYVSYTAKDLKPHGLDKPDMTVTVRLEGGKTLTMKLSKPEKDGGRKGVLAGKDMQGKVFTLTKADIEKFAKDIKDFVKS